MTTKECLRNQLERTRAYSEELLAAFRSSQQWTHQVHPNANHALWFVGHMGVSDNFFISQVAPDRVRPTPEFNALFGTGSRPVGDPAAYPPVEAVLDFMRERRRTLLDVLDRLTEAEMATPAAKSVSNLLPDFAAAFQMAIWHEGLHSGQVSVTHRALGHTPVMGEQAGAGP